MYNSSKGAHMYYCIAYEIEGLKDHVLEHFEGKNLANLLAHITMKNCFEYQDEETLLQCFQQIDMIKVEGLHGQLELIEHDGYKILWYKIESPILEAAHDKLNEIMRTINIGLNGFDGAKWQFHITRIYTKDPIDYDQHEIIVSLGDLVLYRSDTGQAGTYEMIQRRCQ
jgi:2'-5' RNA ligase